MRLRWCVNQESTQPCFVFFSPTSPSSMAHPVAMGSSRPLTVGEFHGISQQIMAPSSTSCKSYMRLCHPPRRRNLVPSSSLMQNLPLQCTTHSKNLATTNHEHPYKRTTKRQTIYSPIKLCQRHWRRWICASIAYGVNAHKVDSGITGNRAHRPWQTISPSTTQPATT